MSLSEDALRNREVWTKVNAEYTGPQARRDWGKDEIVWGVWATPEAEVGVLGELAEKDVVELGCGTAYISAWLAKRGARPVGVDPTPAQLETARRMMAETGIEFPLVEASAEEVPLPDNYFRITPSTSRSPSTARPSGRTPKGGFRRRIACSGRAASSSSSATHRSR